MRGHWNKLEQTAGVLVDGHYRKDDIGYLDETRYLLLVDRSKDMIVSGGKNHACGYEVPKAIDLRSEPVPKSGRGQVLKRELRAPCWEGRDRQVS